MERVARGETDTIFRVGSLMAPFREAHANCLARSSSTAKICNKKTLVGFKIKASGAGSGGPLALGSQRWTDVKPTTCGVGGRTSPLGLHLSRFHLTSFIIIAR